MLDHAFRQLNIKEVVSFTALANKPSQAVMQRIGMVESGENFSHPALPGNHSLAEHVLYKMTAVQWEKKRKP